MFWENLWLNRAENCPIYTRSCFSHIHSKTACRGFEPFCPSEMGVELSTHFNKNASTGFFGGEGFIMQKLSGQGTAFVELDGELVEYDLASGQQMVVDTGNVAGFEATVNISIESVKGIKNKMLGGEGFFNTILTGPGKIWLQTMSIENVANAIRPFIPTGNS